ncbi:E3 ubiquitin-protein ligase pdzrn3 [Plakobranchus ocellatus]|uniref:E3 ubiquitin-protein ligase pdzrn3 n=1 Tax=Plakobranchus ocellatus TaxID=259542 RepID=A0AAV3ZU67_9GAST|nr:E3 ubiquitin-protein ligase pdzrn3 [Plakobranchus ocellatus]
MSRFDVKSFCSPPDPELVCGICMNVLDDPKETPCRHVFCRICITTALENKRRCPMCRRRCKIHELRTVLPLVQNLLNKLNMKCKNFRDGEDGISCKQIIKKEYYLEHIKKCDFAYIDCPYTDCKALVLRKDRCQHKQSCEYRLVTCTNGCETQFRWKERSSHCCIKALKKLVKDLEEDKKDLQKRVERLEQQRHRSDPFVSTRTTTARRSEAGGSSHSRRTPFSSSSHTRQSPSRFSIFSRTISDFHRASTHGTDQNHNSASTTNWDDNVSSTSRRAGTPSASSHRILGAWGLLGFGSDSEADRAGSEAQNTIYDNYGPPMVVMEEEDIYANYAREEGDEEPNANRRSWSVTPPQSFSGWGQNRIANPDNVDRATNVSEHVENEDELGNEGNWRENYDDDYNEDYDSYMEDVNDSYPLTSEDEEQRDDVGENGRVSVNQSHSDDGNNNLEYDMSSSQHVGATIEINDDPEDRGREGQNGHESNHASGASCALAEFRTGTADCNGASASDSGQKRCRDSSTEQGNGAGPSKKSRVDAAPSTATNYGECSNSTQISERNEVNQGSMDSNDINSTQQASAEDEEQADVRRSARLRGLDAAPSAIPNVAVPLTTAQLLERLIESDEESDDPSWDSDEYL